MVNTHPDNWKNPEIPKLLKQGQVISMRPMKEHLESREKKIEFDGEVYLVELDNGLKAVFKPLPEDDLDNSYAEVAAYEASVMLGFPHIPPTIMVTIKGKKGSLQLFVETPLDALDLDVYRKAFENAPIDDVANLKLFYFIFGQWDTGPHNTLILKDQAKTYLIAIDNSGICNRQHVKYGSLPFVRVLYSDQLRTDDWDKPFPFDQEKSIENPTVEKVRRTFKKTLPDSFYAALKFYDDHPFRYVVYQNSLWRRYHADEQLFIVSFTTYLPEQTKKKLEALNLAVLKKVFDVSKSADFPTSAYLKAVLDRRDQVLKYFKKHS